MQMQLNGKWNPVNSMAFMLTADYMSVTVSIAAGIRTAQGQGLALLAL